ncbi:MAG: nuclear transport factor 2 family protein [Tepidisphaeraceae bacterium]
MVDPGAVVSLAQDVLNWAAGSPPTHKAVMLAAFKGVNDRSPDGIMACWASDGVYDNPMVGAAAEGYDAVRQCMVNLCDGLAKSGHFLVVDRVTIGEHNVVAEWHVEPVDGRKGVHVADFNADGKLKRVTVYPRGK